MKILKKISRGFLKLILFLVCLVMAGYILFRSIPFQNYLAQKVVHYLSQELKTKVTLRSVDLELLNTLVLEGLCVEDQQGDTLGYFGKLKVDFNYKMVFNNALQLAKVRSVLMQDAQINLIQHEGNPDFNYQFLIDYFSPPRKSTGKHIPFTLLVNRLELDRVNFRYLVEGETPPEGRSFNESDMEYKNIHAVFFPFKLIDDSLDFDIRHLSFTEKSGFKVLDLSSKAVISGTKLEFSSLNLTTPHSHIGNYLKFSYKNYGELSDFVEKVNWTAYLRQSVVHTKDLTFFTDAVSDYNIPVAIDGKAKGTLQKLYGKRLDLRLGDLNRFEGDFVLTNLTQTDLLGFNLKVNKLTANPSSVQQIFSVPMPEALLRIGSVQYSGDLKGTLTRYGFRGVIETTVGKIRTDLELEFPENGPEKYKGEAEFFGFNTGVLLNRAEPGELNMLAVFDGKGFTPEALNTSLTGNVRSFVYDGYNYQNITLDGLFQKKLFNGLVDIKDPNLNLNLKGTFDLNNPLPQGDFRASTGLINLKKLGYGDINIHEISHVDIKFEGNDLDNLTSNAMIRNLVLEKKDTLYRLGNIYLDAFGPPERRSVSLNSDLGKVSVIGQYRLSNLESTVNNILYHLFPKYYAKLYKKTELVDFRFEIDITDSRYLSALFMPELSLQGFSVSGIYNSQNQNMDVVARAEKLRYLNYSFEQTYMESIKKPEERLSLNTRIGKFFISDSLITDKLNLSADIGGNDIHFSLNVSDTTHDLSLKSAGNVLFSKNSIDFSLDPSALFIYSKPWYFNRNHHFRYEKSALHIDSFNISDGLQTISLQGSISDKNFDSLQMHVDAFDLSELNPVLSKWGIAFEGITNGKFMMNGPHSRPVVVSDFSIADLAYNNDSVGDVRMTSQSSGSPYKMEVSGNIQNGLIHDMKVGGSVDLTPGNDKLDLMFEMKRTQIKPFEIFTEGLFSNIDGVADATLILRGTFEKPDLRGLVEIQKGGLYMDYLALPLRFDAVTIELLKDVIQINSFPVYDKHGSEALAGGKIYHKNFDNLRFDIFMKNLVNFNCMNLDEFQNDLFFGTAYVDGSMRVKGPIDELYLDIQAKTRPKTVISVPLAGNSENTGPDYIEVVDLRAETALTQFKKMSGITMDFVFDVTPDAEIKLIFDSKFNDVIRATGYGNLKMELNTYGDFYMYGGYTIATGSYNFTALNNIVNKNLKVKPGGKITWNGPPLDALLDLVATTTVKADPSVILPSTSSGTGTSTGNVAVDCEINMKDKLFSPQIQLGIDLAKENQTTLFANTELTNAINQIKSDQDETNKQFINLLVFNAFAPINAGTSNPTSEKALSSFQNSIGEFMTSQLNNWLSQIDPNWDLDVDFSNTGNTDANQKVIVSLRRKLYNDRLEIGGTYGQAGTSSYDVNVSYKISKDGRLLVRAFNKQANDPVSANPTTINTSGLGLYYRKETDYFFPKWRKKMYDKKHRQKQALN